MMKSTTILAGTAAVLIALAGGVGAADAKGKGSGFKFGHKHFHHKHFRHRHFYPVISYGGCGYEKPISGGPQCPPLMRHRSGWSAACSTETE